MSADFLTNFMRVARDVTGAERCMAVDISLAVRDSLNIDVDGDMEIYEIARPCLSQAIESGESVITNNIITDPAQAPVTNTNFSDLRVMVAIPVADMGAIYLDQHIRRGVIPRETIERLSKLAVNVIQQGQTSTSEGDLRSLYEQL